MKSLYWKICATFLLVQLVSVLAGITAFNTTWRNLRARSDGDRFGERGDRNERGDRVERAPGDRPDRVDRAARIERASRISSLLRLLPPQTTGRRGGMMMRHARSRRGLLETIGRVAARDVAAALDRNAAPDEITKLLDGMEGDHADLDISFVSTQGAVMGQAGDWVPSGRASTDESGQTFQRLETYGYATRIEVPPHRGWVYVAQAPTGPQPSDPDEINWHLMQAGAAALGVIFLVAISVGFLAFWAIARRLRELGTCLGAVAEGELSRRVPQPGNDEIGNLGTSFNRMASRLQEVVERLEELGERRREFLADVSHELRTPLTSVRANIESLLEPEPPPPAGGPVDDGPGPHELAVMHSIEEIDHMTCLVEDLLELARMESPQYHLVKETVELQRLVKDMVGRLRTSVQNRGIKVVTKLAPEPVRRSIDPRRIGQVVTNLMVNAIRSLDQGGSIDVSVSETEGRAVIEVADTGPGIPESVRARLFEPFQTTRSKTGGTGLGLAIVKKLVDAHGGNIDLLPRPGGGTIARVEL